LAADKKPECFIGMNLVHNDQFHWCRLHYSSRFRLRVYLGGQLAMPERNIDSIDDPKHWRERAEEARAMAEKINDPASKEAMLRIARDYEMNAEYARIRAEVRVWSKLRPGYSAR
jgi:hypothetical protein